MCVPMNLRRWRKQKRLTLTEGAKYLGLKSIGALSDIERGMAFPSPETIVTIFGATKGLVKSDDHFAVWRAHDPSRYSELLAAGRAAAKAYQPPVKEKKAWRKK
jgi:transcriptional regulator with XRE-family HTH domain